MCLGPTDGWHRFIDQRSVDVLAGFQMDGQIWFVQYTTKEGKTVEPKIFRHDFSCCCQVTDKNPVKYTGRVSVSPRQHCFHMFWNLASYSAQNVYIAGAVKETGISRKYSQTNKRQYTRKYFPHDVPVCRNTFVKSLGISTKHVNTALKKKRAGCLDDSRGGRRESHTLSAAALQKVKYHINAFPRYKSHYTRAVSTISVCGSNVVL